MCHLVALEAMPHASLFKTLTGFRQKRTPLIVTKKYDERVSFVCCVSMRVALNIFINREAEVCFSRDVIGKHFNDLIIDL